MLQKGHIVIVKHLYENGKVNSEVADYIKEQLSEQAVAYAYSPASREEASREAVAEVDNPTSGPEKLAAKFNN